MAHQKHEVNVKKKLFPGMMQKVAAKIRNVFLHPQKKPQEPTYEELAASLRALVPNMVNGAFTGFVIVGYRRVPLAERPKYGGQEEVPFYFYHFQELFPAGALMDWSAEDIKARLVTAAMQAKQNPPAPLTGAVEKEKA